MRRDVYIENDSGGLSVIAAAAADAIIADRRDDDVGFVSAHQALLLELYGDDSMPVRVVVDEPLTADEEAQWLARATWRIDAPDGRLLVMGGFDPDVLSWWRDGGAPDQDASGVAVIAAPPGAWCVDVYAHVGSMNGRYLLDEASGPLGAAFRASHPGRPFPLWLAAMLEFDGEEDPGNEALWSDVAGSFEAGALAVDTDVWSAVGFLIHLTPYDGQALDAPDGGWFELDAGARVPATFPVGLPAAVPDPDLESLRDKILRIERPVEPPAAATDIVEIIECWTGDPVRAIEGRPPTLAPAEAYFAYWAVAMTSDSTTAWELWVTAPTGGWQPPDPTEYFGVAQKAADTWALGAPVGHVGWPLWWGVRAAAARLTELPADATLVLAIAPRDRDEDQDPAVGRAYFGGPVRAGAWSITEISPAVGADAVEAALAFVRELVEDERITVRGPDERRALQAAAEVAVFGDDALTWVGDAATFADPDERTLLMLGERVARVRFADRWRCDAPDDD
jgi:hypothetical protein